MESQFNKPLYNEDLGIINDIISSAWINIKFLYIRPDNKTAIVTLLEKWPSLRVVFYYNEQITCTSTNSSGQKLLTAKQASENLSDFIKL